jgi:tetratricopeptide (TPR) repeat protein
MAIVAEESQWFGESQKMFDEAINLCPNLSYAWKEKAVPHLKSGDFITWERLIKKAVEYDPQGILGYRGWCRFQFFRDYEGAISDFESLEKMVNFDIGYSQNGDYHLKVAKGLSYFALGKPKQAIKIIEEKFKEKDYNPLLYDYYQLGCIYLSVKNMKKALSCFNKQSKINEFSENLYRISFCNKKLGNYEKYLKYKKMALAMYKTVKTLRDPYTEHLNKIYLKDIVRL